MADDSEKYSIEPARQAVHSGANNRLALHVLLLFATIYTTMLAGAAVNPATATLDSSSRHMLSLELLVLGLPYSFCILAILGVHEMGHYLACRYYGVDASLPFFLPNPVPVLGTFGAFIKIRAPIPDRNALFDIGVAGPIAGFVVAVPVMILGSLTATLVPLEADAAMDLPLVLRAIRGLMGLSPPEGYGMIISGPLYAGWVGCLATAMNLFPIGQLDGGHVSYAISGTFHRYFSIAGIAMFWVLGLLVFPGWLFFAMLIILFGSRHPPVLNEQVPLTSGRRIVALLSFVILVICFIPRPFPV